jgi:NodT family efflux transporter outer membrane factor (OMF) lipoprotein
MRRTTLLLAFALAGCAVGPRYERPDVETPVAFKEGQGAWVPAKPADHVERGPWWEQFGDAELNTLAAQVEVNNQNVAQAVARYAQARAILAEQRASLFPSVSLSGGAQRSGGRSTPERNSFTFSVGTSWEPDVWGRLRAGVESARAALDVSAADLRSAKLSAQSELAINYFNLRELDLATAIQAGSIEGYERTLRIAQNRYNAGIVARTDLLQAQTQLASARAEMLTLERQRANLEHAIAVLVGRAPSNFSLARRPAWAGVVPNVPVDVPSVLLQRRPDIAAAERRVAQANARIGIEMAGYFPSLRLSGSGGQSAARIGDLFSVSSLAWSLGLSLAQSIFDAGATSARVEGARAGLQEAAAQYRQTVLAAFQEVEDQLVAARVLQQQLALREEASRAADLVEQQVLNRYQAGQVSFTEVVSAQVTAANARRALAQAIADRAVAGVSLITALGGGWTVGD